MISNKIPDAFICASFKLKLFFENCIRSVSSDNKVLLNCSRCSCLLEANLFLI